MPWRRTCWPSSAPNLVPTSMRCLPWRECPGVGWLAGRVPDGFDLVWRATCRHAVVAEGALPNWCEMSRQIGNEDDNRRRWRWSEGPIRSALSPFRRLQSVDNYGLNSSLVVHSNSQVPLFVSVKTRAVRVFCDTHIIAPNVFGFFPRHIPRIGGDICQFLSRHAKAKLIFSVCLGWVWVGVNLHRRCPRVTPVSQRFIQFPIRILESP